MGQHWLVRLNSLNCCSEIRRHHGEQAAAKTLVAALRSPYSNGRGDEIMAFREFPEVSVVELSKMLDDPQPAFRLVAAQMLGNLAPAARSTVPQLIKRLHDQPDVQRAAIDALDNLGEASEPVRARWCRCSSPRMSSHAMPPRSV